MKKNSETVSVVIATLGGDINSTINSLNNGSVCPKEIIVSLPSRHQRLINLTSHSNVKVVYAEKFGQVDQRIYGFNKAKGSLVLQLDDDVIFQYECLENLVSELIALPRNSSISPTFYNLDGQAFYQAQRKGVLAKIYYYIVNGKRGFVPGGVTSAGTNFGVNPDDIGDNIVEVEWQTGGCVLHRRDNILLKSYFPFSGKSYCEDLISSFLLREKGVTLYVSTKALCSAPRKRQIFVGKELVKDFRARLYFVRMAKLSVARMLVHYVAHIIRALKFR